ncbi:MAG: hypothetical protein ACRBM6_31580 [Geminicoccales bacterium]
MQDVGQGDSSSHQLFGGLTPGRVIAEEAIDTNGMNVLVSHIVKIG